MAVSLRFIPGSTIRWQERRFVVVDYAGMDALVAREVGKRRFQRVPVSEAVTDLTPGNRDAWTPDLVSVPEKAGQTIVKRFKSRFAVRSERSCYRQRRRSIRYAKAGRRQGTPLLHKQGSPSPNRNRPTFAVRK